MQCKHQNKLQLRKKEKEKTVHITGITKEKSTEKVKQRKGGKIHKLTLGVTLLYTHGWLDTGDNCWTQWTCLGWGRWPQRKKIKGCNLTRDKPGKLRLKYWAGKTTGTQNTNFKQRKAKVSNARNKEIGGNMNMEKHEKEYEFISTQQYG